MCSYVAIHILVGLLDPFKNYVINQFIRKKKLAIQRITSP